VTASWKASHLVQDSNDPPPYPECHTELEKCIPGALLDCLLILVVLCLGEKKVALELEQRLNLIMVLEEFK